MPPTVFPAAPLRRKRAFTLLELLAAITIIGIIAAIVMPRLTAHTRTAKENCCRQYESDLNAALERYFVDFGSYPNDLSDLNPDYYPEAIPSCPVDSSAYAIDPVTQRVSSHGH